MNNRFKFRVWHKGHSSGGEMFYPVFSASAFKWLEEGQPVEIMQWTGLKDKNGKEIYESDILKFDGSVVGAVSFVHAEFIVGEGVNARALCNAPEDAIEIIGNKWENPDLLK